MTEQPETAEATELDSEATEPAETEQTAEAPSDEAAEAPSE